jgi:hypothetical protein
VINSGRDDPRGFRCASPGTEAAFHLTVETLRPIGSLDSSARHFARARDLARQDPRAFLASMTLMHGSMGKRAASHFLQGTWTFIEGLLLIGRRIVRGPQGLYRRTVTWVRRRRLAHWRGLPREIPDGVEEWLFRIGRSHRVSETRMGQGR